MFATPTRRASNPTGAIALGFLSRLAPYSCSIGSHATRAFDLFDLWMLNAHDLAF